MLIFLLYFATYYFMGVAGGSMGHKILALRTSKNFREVFWERVSWKETVKPMVICVVSSLVAAALQKALL